jgi:membrane protease YdiL (CAAX protease family)
VVLAFFLVGVAVPLAVGGLLTSVGFYQLVYGPGFPTTGTDDPAAAAMRGVWAGLLAAPFQLGGLLVARHMLFRPARPWAGPGDWTGAVATGAWWWAVLTPGVLLLHAGVNAAFVWLGWGPEEHPLTQLGAERPIGDRALFVLQAGVVAPFLEEVLFRGVLLGWLIGGYGKMWRVRVACALAAGLVVAVGTSVEHPFGPGGFALLLLLGWAVLRIWVRKERLVGSVYASAALFAAVHSSVWPTPIPLFVLGLGLGWVAVRTNSVLAPAVVHGLFNTVSVLFVLSGGAK